VSLGVGFSTNTGAPRPGHLRRPERVRQAHEEQRAVRTEAPGARTDFYWPTTSGGYNDSVGGGFDREDIAARSPAPPASGHARLGHAAAGTQLKLEALTEQVTIDQLPTTRVKSLPLTYSITKRAARQPGAPTRGYIVNGSWARPCCRS
jgi:translocation and assembly module TamA